MSEISTIDYPGYVAYMVFTEGCNLKCTYCQNPELLTFRKMGFGKMLFEIRMNELIDAVVVTGGEPTLQENLPKFLRLIRRMGHKVKLDTNGLGQHFYDCAKEADYIAMDIKTEPSGYRFLRGLGLTDEKINSLIERTKWVIDNKEEYEFRLTCVYPYITNRAIPNIGALLQDAKLVYLQEARDAERAIPPETIEKLKERLSKFIRGKVEVRLL